MCPKERGGARIGTSGCASLCLRPWVDGILARCHAGIFHVCFEIHRGALAPLGRAHRSSETLRNIQEVLVGLIRLILGLFTDKQEEGLRTHLEPEDMLLQGLLRQPRFLLCPSCALNMSFSFLGTVFCFFMFLFVFFVIFSAGCRMLTLAEEVLAAADWV